MTDVLDQQPTRSRRALLTAAAGAAAGAAAAVAASAAAPAAVFADDPNDVVKDTDNATTAVTSITQGTTDTNAFEGHGNGLGVGIVGTTDATKNAGVIGMAGDTTTATYVTQAFDLDTGLYGFSGSASGLGTGVYGEGTFGIWGWGDVGTRAEGETIGLLATARPSGTAVHAHAGTADIPAALADVALRGTVTSNTQVGLRVNGRVQLVNRSGKASISAGRSSKAVSVSGMTSGNYAFAVLNGNRSGIYVRAVVPAAGKITIYLNKAVSSTTSVAWMVLG